MAQLQGHQGNAGNITPPEPEMMKKAKLEKDLPTPSADTSDTMSVDGDGDEEEVKKENKEESDTFDSAPILPGMTGTVLSLTCLFQC